MMELVKIINGEVVDSAIVRPEDATAWIKDAPEWSPSDGKEVGMIADGAGGFSHPAAARSDDPAAPENNLTPRQFHWFTAKYDYDDVLDLVLAELKANAKDVYADIVGDIKGARRFRFDVVAAVMANASVVPHLPRGVDLTPETMATRWMEAKQH